MNPKNNNLSNNNHNKKQKTHWFRKLLMIPVVFLILTIVFITFFLGLMMNQWKEFDPDKLENIQQTSFIYDMNGHLISEIHSVENRVKVPLSSIPKHVQEAFIAVEDVRFYQHRGFDIKRMIGALIEDIKAGGYVQGASTITQQVIRNSHLSKEKTFSRKIQEIYLAYQIEQKYSKDQILQMYLNLIYFGNGAYGIEAASKIYFGKSVDKLSIAEGALLAGIPKNPSRYAPLSNLKGGPSTENLPRALDRKNLAISLMAKYGFISEEEGIRAKQEKIILNPARPDYTHGYFMDMVLKEASEKLGISEELLYTNGYRIYTTLDSRLQQFVEEIYTQENLFPKSPGNGIPCEGALVVLDAESGEIRAIMGGRKYPDNQRKVLNRASQVRRQPGSTIKPLLVYSPALENFGYTAATFIEDAAVTYSEYTPPYSPSNYGGGYSGWVTLRYALAKSINIPAVKVLYDIGISNGILFAEKLGIPFSEGDSQNLSLALGGFSKGVTPLELARAYAALADEGMYKDTTTIQRIEDPYGTVLYKHAPQKRRVMSEETAFIMSSILQSAVEWGTASSKLGSLGYLLAAKTGSVQLPNTPEFSGIQGNHDAWITAYNPDYVVTVWMGFDKTNSQNYLPKNAVGGAQPAEIARQIIQYLFRSQKPRPFQMPPGVVEVKLDATSLLEDKRQLLASPLTPPENIVIEFFTKSTAPKEESKYWVIPKPPSDFNVSLTDSGQPLVTFIPQETFAAYDIYRIEDGETDPVNIARLQTGNLDSIKWIDSTALKGKEYGYYVVPVHPEIFLNGESLKGLPTRTITIITSYNPSSDQEPNENSESTEPQPADTDIEFEIIE